MKNNLRDNLRKSINKFGDAQTFKADSQYQSDCLKAAIDCLAELKGWSKPAQKNKKVSK